MATALEVFALNSNLESSDLNVKSRPERKVLIKGHFFKKISPKNPAIIFSQEVFSKELVELVKEGLGKKTYEHELAQV